MVVPINLTKEQQEAIIALVNGVRQGRSIQTLGGYAGTGKTTLIATLLDTIPDIFQNLVISVCAFTGKAANVLRRKGVASASTIHSLIYEARRDPSTNKIEFTLRESLPCDLIIVDEASMVGKDLYDDLLSFNLPTIFVGDHGQLEPVGSDFNLMKFPDYRLESIHRNAGEISRFAEWVRNGNKAIMFPVEEGKIEFLKKWDIDERNLWTDTDQIICAYNKTRVQTNDLVRKKLHHTQRLEIGERVMCLRNNREHAVFNGMQGTILSHYKKGRRNFMDLDSYGNLFYGVPYEPTQFGQEKTLPMESRDDPIPFDYAYCITGHKSQGDQFPSVMVFEQICTRWDHKRWAYTVASRAEEKVYWVTGM